MSNDKKSRLPTPGSTSGPRRASEKSCHFRQASSVILTLPGVCKKHSTFAKLQAKEEEKLQIEYQCPGKPRESELTVADKSTCGNDNELRDIAKKCFPDIDQLRQKFLANN